MKKKRKENGPTKKENRWKPKMLWLEEVASPSEWHDPNDPEFRLLAEVQYQMRMANCRDSVIPKKGTLIQQTRELEKIMARYEAEAVKLGRMLGMIKSTDTYANALTADSAGAKKEDELQWQT